MSDSLAESSLSLWALAIVVLLMATHLAFGYLRQALRESRRRPRVLLAVAAAAALATGLWSEMLLSMSSQALSYSLGFNLSGLLLAWLVPAAATLLAWLLLMRWLTLPMVIGAGGVLSVGILLAQVLLVREAGLTPGVRWQKEALTLAVPVFASGCIAGLWTAFLGAGRKASRRRLWRFGAAGMLTFAVVAGQELLMAAAAMPAQAASAYHAQAPAEAVCLIAGLVVPFVMLMLMLAQQLHRPPVDPTAPTPRRRRRRIKTRPLL